MIGEVNRIVFDDNKYYVRSTNSMQNGKLFVFDKDGKFLQQIGRKGGGPDEYIEMDDSLFPIITRMVLQNLFAEELPVDMRVDFGRSNILVSQHLLDGAQVCSAFQKVCGKGMAVCCLMMRNTITRVSGAPRRFRNKMSSAPFFGVMNPRR